MDNVINNLLQKAILFNKTAGLITVPPALLKRVEDWAIGIYAERAVSQYDNYILSLIRQTKNRNLFVSMLEQAKKCFSSLYNVGETEDPISEDINKIISWAKENHTLSIPYFYSDEEDEIPIDKKKVNALKISIDTLPNNKFNLQINTNENIPRDIVEDYNIIPVNIYRRDLSTDQLISLLQKAYETIKGIYYAFEYTVSNLEYHSKEELAPYYVERAKLKKLSEQYGTSLANPEIFYFEASLLPTIKNLIPEANTLNFSVFFKKRTKDDYGSGFWSKSNKSWHLGTVQIVPSLKELDNTSPSKYHIKESIEDIKDTVRHELIHMIQTAIARIKNLKEEGGLPSKRIREEGVDYYGTPTSNNPSKERIEHGLRDIEFYTRLSDSVKMFINIARELPMPLRTLAAKVWVGEANANVLINAFSDYYHSTYGQMATFSLMRTITNKANDLMNKDDFFINLRVSQPLKYHKAIKEFYKAVLSITLA